MRLIFILILLFSLNVKAQTKEYKCITVGIPGTPSDFKVVSRKITISKDSIIIPKFLDGGKFDVILKVDSLVTKEYKFFDDGLCDWYYCLSTQIDSDGNFRKGIVIVPRSKSIMKKNIYWFDFATEVNVYHFNFGYK